MKEETKGKTRGRKNMGLTQHHLTIWVYPPEWEKLKYLASATNKTVSKFVEDNCMSNVKISKIPVSVRERDKSQKGCIKPLSFASANYNSIQEFVKKNELNLTEFILNSCF
jgi:hypothetical protein